MGLFNYMKEKVFFADMTGTVVSEVSASICYKEFALQSCISIIANALVLSEFETFEKGERIRGEMYYLLNVQPNNNQNGTEFWTDAISKLVYENECLIVMHKDQLFVADQFTHTPYVFYEDSYSEVTVRGYKLKDKFRESDVIYLKLNNKDIKHIIDGLYSDYSVLLTSAIKNYKKASGTKLKLEIDAVLGQMNNQKESLEKMINGQYKNFIEADSGVLPVSKGMSVDEFKNTSIVKDSRDVRHLVNDIIDFICAALHIPSGIVKGDVVNITQQTDNFLMFGLNPIAKLITTELNRKVYTKEEYLARTYLKMDTQKIRLVDISEVSKTSDMLFRIGVNTINDNLELIGREPINEDWANERFVTKNYSRLLSDEIMGTDEEEPEDITVDKPVLEDEVEDTEVPVDEVEETVDEETIDERSEFKKKYKVKTKRKK